MVEGAFTLQTALPGSHGQVVSQEVPVLVLAAQGAKTGEKLSSLPVSSLKPTSDHYLPDCSGSLDLRTASIFEK